MPWSSSFDFVFEDIYFLFGLEELAHKLVWIFLQALQAKVSHQLIAIKGPKNGKW